MVNRYRYFLISLAVIFLDQISKNIIRNTLEIGQVLKITNKFFWLTHVQNTGAAFSISLSNPVLNKFFFIIISILAIIFLIILIIKSRSKIEKIVFALILGGASGNLIDRIILGSVTDFLWCDFPDVIMKRWPVFNLADSSIVIAITILIFYMVFFSKKSVEDK
jgi:signal peptidase II